MIGADGLGSATRAADARRRRAAPHRLCCPSHHRADGARACGRAARRCRAVGRAGLSHRALSAATEARLFNIVAVFRTSTYAEKGDLAGYRAELEHDLPRFASGDEIAAGDDGPRAALGDLRPRPDPALAASGRVVLLGDAAHPTLQSLAQGACMAIEDAVCLAELIACGPRRFRQRRSGATKSARLLRTARVQLESRALWPFYHAEGIARDVRNVTTASGQKTTCSAASPGSTTASRCRPRRRISSELSDRVISAQKSPRCLRHNRDQISTPCLISILVGSGANHRL